MLKKFIVDNVEKYDWNRPAQLMKVTYTDGSEELYYGVVEYSVLSGLEVPGNMSLKIKILGSHFIPVKDYSKIYTHKPESKIKNVVFNEPATIVFWKDGTKTVVKCGENDTYDPEKGLAMAVAKKYLGTNESKSNYLDEFKKWLTKEEETEKEKLINALNAFAKAMKDSRR